ncbi:MAG: PEP-CTERM sorting domain-containing protein [Planctomycetota bacterium]
MKVSPPATLTLLAATVGLAAPPVSGQLALTDFEDGTTGTVVGADTFSATSSMPGATKPRLTVADDSAGLGSGNALFVESGGSGSELIAYLDGPVTIGPNVGDGIALQFDWRLQGSATEQGLPLDSGDFRFGFFSDADNSLGQQFGTFNTYEGEDEFGNPILVSTDPAIFGSTGGEFDGSGGPIDPDYGIHVRTDFNRFVSDVSTLPTSANDNQFQNVRIREENPGAGGIFSGSGDTIVAPVYEEVNPGQGDFELRDIVEGGTNYGELRDGNANTFRLELIRGNDGTEDRIIGRYTIINALGTTVFEDSDPFSQMNEITFDYIGFENSEGDFDYVIDNLSVFTLPAVSEGLIGDFSGDSFVGQDDLNLVLLNFGATVLPPGFDVSGLDPETSPDGFDGILGQNELNDVLLNFGNSAPVVAVPEPTSLALLGLVGLGLVSRRRKA